MATGEKPRREKQVPKNPKTVTRTELKKMPPVQRARLLAYEQPSKDMAASLQITQSRLKEFAQKSVGDVPQMVPDPEEERKMKVIGQLKAAEARSRIRLTRLRFQCMRAQELNHLIACQPTARDAIRLEVFLPTRPATELSPDPLDRIQRAQVERLLEDDVGYLTNRIA
ncbi:hypothetical protein XENTR_v10003395 [Xenopus tropicalis]|uniref:LKAAEAR motif containing 1 n=1 Tax=Xenopus tropicalis TaxID=8364 RepID=A0A803K1H6_XENTR|nr:protein LKAAEAR1 [Xenopus tropicalis]XP_031750557.1 protein LKAAEAR1 [Xenopus tropicalis]KAE8574366.1 hypothetical protein XENTR_v10003395 [Xenopus tropicalis]